MCGAESAAHWTGPGTNTEGTGFPCGIQNIRCGQNRGLTKTVKWAYLNNKGLT